MMKLTQRFVVSKQSLLEINRSSYIASVGDDLCVNIIDIASRKIMKRFKDIHQAKITAFAFSPDCRLIATASEDKTIKVIDCWQMEIVYASKQDYSYYKLTGSPSALALYPDANFFISCCGERFKIHDIKQNTVIYTSEKIHDGKIRTAVITPNSRYLITAGSDKCVRVTDLITKKIVNVFENVHKGVVLAWLVGTKANPILIDWISKIAISEKMDILVVASWDNSLSVIDFEQKTSIMKFEKMHSDIINDVAISSDGKLIATASEDTTVKLFDWETKELVKLDQLHRESITSVCFTQDCTMLITASTDRSIKIVNPDTREIIYTFLNAHWSSVISIKTGTDFSQKLDELLKLDRDHKELSTKKVIDSYDAVHLGWVSCLRVTPDSKYIVSSSYDKTLRVIDLERRDYRIIDKIHVDWINCLAIPQDYRFIATASADRSIKLVDFWTEESLCKFDDIHRDSVTSISMDAEANILVSGGLDNVINIVDLGTNIPYQTYKEVHKNFQEKSCWVNKCVVSPDGKYIISGGADSTAVLLDTRTQEPIEIFNNLNRGKIRAVAFSPDSQRFICAGTDSRVHVVAIGQKEPEYVFETLHQDWVNDISFSPNGALFASCCWGNKLKIVDFASKSEICCFNRDLCESPKALAFSPDSKFVVVGTKEGSVRVLAHNAVDNQVLLSPKTNSEKKFSILEGKNP